MASHTFLSRTGFKAAGSHKNNVVNELEVSDPATVAKLHSSKVIEGATHYPVYGTVKLLTAKNLDKSLSQGGSLQILRGRHKHAPV